MKQYRAAPSKGNSITKNQQSVSTDANHRSETKRTPFRQMWIPAPRTPANSNSLMTGAIVEGIPTTNNSAHQPKNSADRKGCGSDDRHDCVGDTIHSLLMYSYFSISVGPFYARPALQSSTSIHGVFRPGIFRYLTKSRADWLRGCLGSPKRSMTANMYQKI